MAGPEERGGGGSGRGRNPLLFLIMVGIFVGVILVALHMLHQVGNALP